MYVLFCSVIMSLLLAKIMFHKENQTQWSICDFHHIFIEKLHIKTTTVSINQQHRNNTVFLALSYNFKAFKCLSTFLRLCPDTTPPS